MVNILITFLFLILSTELYAKDLINDPELNKAFTKFTEAYEKDKNLTTTERAQFYYETSMDDKKACSHCPEYLNLIKEVNKIVGKVAVPQDVARANDQMIQVDRLKFVYFESIAAINGTETCSVFNNADPSMLDGIEREKLTMMSEQLLNLSNVTSLQYYPTPPQTEIRYLYRGEGLQSHVIIEVIVKADKTALIRYHHYDPYNLPDIGGSVTKDKTKLNEFETRSLVGSEIKVDTKTVLNPTNQSTQASLKTSAAEWIKIEARHENDKEASVKTYLPVEISLPSETGAKITGEFSHEQKENLTTDVRQRINQAELKISNDNKQELRARLEKSDGREELIVGSQYQIDLSENLKVNTQAEQKEITLESGKNRQQKVGVSFKDNKGNHEYIDAELDRNADTEKIHLSTKHQWVVNEERGLKVRGEASQTTVSNPLDKNKSNEMILSLTDHNHEYVTARVVQGDDLDRLIALSSKFTIGDYGSVTSSVNHYDSGREQVSVGHKMTSGKNSFQTDVGVDSLQGEFLNFKMERKISKVSSMVVSVKTHSTKETTLMYQFESKF